MKKETESLRRFQRATSSEQRREIANEVHTYLSTLTVDEQTNIRQALKQFVLSEANQSINRIESSLTGELTNR